MNSVLVSEILTRHCEKTLYVLAEAQGRHAIRERAAEAWGEILNHEGLAKENSISCAMRYCNKTVQTIGGRFRSVAEITDRNEPMQVVGVCVRMIDNAGSEVCAIWSGKNLLFITSASGKSSSIMFMPGEEEGVCEAVGWRTRMVRLGVTVSLTESRSVLPWNGVRITVEGRDSIELIFPQAWPDSGRLSARTIEACSRLNRRVADFILGYMVWRNHVFGLQIG